NKVRNFLERKINRNYGGNNRPLNSVVSEKENEQREIIKIADRIDRCADRFANANDERMELIARKVAIAINQCKVIASAEKLEKSFHSVYLSSSQASTIAYLTLHNLLSDDTAYENPKLPPTPVEAPPQDHFTSESEEPITKMDIAGAVLSEADIRSEALTNAGKFAEGTASTIFEAAKAGIKFAGAFAAGYSVGADMKEVSDDYKKDTTSDTKIYHTANLVVDTALLVGAVGLGTVSAPYIVAAVVVQTALKLYTHYNPEPGK
ncbi:MAG TPA: hypothetical protein VNX68_13310, partial [Nitrosopumilaceae archaeon]|nr:hypothetical protein [Nitrosopumilaceae archaeon]